MYVATCQKKTIVWRGVWTKYLILHVGHSAAHFLHHHLVGFVQAAGVFGVVFLWNAGGATVVQKIKNFVVQFDYNLKKNCITFVFFVGRNCAGKRACFSGGHADCEPIANAKLVSILVSITLQLVGWCSQTSLSQAASAHVQKGQTH